MTGFVRPSRGVLLALLLVACRAPSSEPGPAAEGRVLVEVEQGPTIGRGSAPAYPSSRQRARSSDPPAAFGFGRAATQQDIVSVDVDVRPDGTGLPPGAGSPTAGGEVYSVKCAYCHGPNGEGGPNDPLLGEGGRTISSYWPYATTVFDYVRRAMPFDRPGSLSDQEVWDVTAWLMWQAGFVEADASVDRATLVGIELPGRGAFVPDDRERFQVVH